MPSVVSRRDDELLGGYGWIKSVIPRLYEAGITKYTYLLN